jgi:hypothetical protein
MTLPDDLPDDVSVEPIFPDEPVEPGDDDDDENATGVRQAEKNREMDPPA